MVCMNLTLSQSCSNGPNGLELSGSFNGLQKVLKILREEKSPELVFGICPLGTQVTKSKSVMVAKARLWISNLEQ